MNYKNIEGYVSELEFQKGKGGKECRIFHDDCAVLDVKNFYRIVAQRGIGSCVGKPLCEVVSLDANFHRSMERFLRSGESRLLMKLGERVYLFLSDWYPFTGLLFMLRFSSEVDKETVSKIMDYAHRDAILPILHPDQNGSSEEILLREKLLEIFYYVDRMHDRKHSLWTHCLCIANFVGCRLQYLRLPVENVELTDEGFRRLSAFLVCLFLTLRHRTGRVSATGDLVHSTNKNVEKVQVNEEAEIYAVKVEQGPWKPPL